MKQYFEILELQPGATPDEVKRAYRDLAKVWHPDRFKGDSPRLKSKAAEKLAEINDAYEKIKAYQARQKARKQASDSQQTSTTTGYRPYSNRPTTPGNGTNVFRVFAAYLGAHPASRFTQFGLFATQCISPAQIFLFPHPKTDVSQHPGAAAAVQPGAEPAQ